MNKKMIISVAVVFVVGGAVGFYGGMKYQDVQVPSRADFTANMRNSAPRQGQFGGVVNGKIISKDDTSITIELSNGQPGQSGSRIVLFSSTTEISKFVAGTAEYLSVGTEVMVRGSQNQDGSLTAQSIQIR